MGIPKVLVADDEPDVQQFLRVILEDAGYAVECASDGHEALGKIDRESPSLVILDLWMPILDGWGVLKRLRGRNAAPPVVILSAFSDGLRAIHEGAVDSLLKPFSADQLLATCARALVR